MMTCFYYFKHEGLKLSFSFSQMNEVDKSGHWDSILTTQLGTCVVYFVLDAHTIEVPVDDNGSIGPNAETATSFQSTSVNEL